MADTRALERIITQMQALQRDIAASGQPPSRFELQALKDLGREYAALVEDLSQTADNNSDKQ